MKNLFSKFKVILPVVIVAILLPLAPVHGTIASVTMVPANPTNLSNGLSYYLAGKTYNFEVTVVDPDVTGWGELTGVRIFIPNTPNIDLFIDPAGTGTDQSVFVGTGNVEAVADVTGTYNNCTITFKVTIRWDTPESQFIPNQLIRFRVDSSAPGNNFRIGDVATSYGVCSSIKILDFQQDGVATDGMVNPYHDGFHVTGVPVYNVPGVTTADAIETVDAGEITGTELFLNGSGTGVSSSLSGAPPGFDFSVPAGTVTTFGANTWTAKAEFVTAGGPMFSSNSLTIDCDEVEITGVLFLGGGGIDSPAYYRSTNIPGTRVRVIARMRHALTGMRGITTIRLNDTGGQNIDVVIPNGASMGIANVPFPTGAGLPGDPGTLKNDYVVSAILGGSYGGDSSGGQNAAGLISQPPGASIYWDRNDAPGADSAPFTPYGGVSSTARSITFNWTALVNVIIDGDFYSYRLYYRKLGEPLFRQIDRNTPGYGYLGVLSTSEATITGLESLTNYEFYITAVDIFGQEVTLANSLPGTGTYGSTSTSAATIRVEISDGITIYDDNSFTDFGGIDNPLDRSLLRTAVCVKVFIIALGEDLPDSVNLIVANVTTGNLIVGGGLNPAIIENSPMGYYRISTFKTSTNEWTGYVPTTLPLMSIGTSLKFVVESFKTGIPSYADNDSETELPPGNPNDYPYTFHISGEKNVAPLPTRILNNVINSKNRRAYPAYFLTDDAYVTIRVYDVKGRVVATLLDRGFRRGGRNIKEGGWGGYNKYGRKLGLGLYYVHFKAKRASDGKVILNSCKKMVMAR